MTPLILAAALNLMVLDAAPANAQPTTVAPATVQADKADADPDKMICHKEEITGSRFAKRVCMTKSQWDEQQRRTEEFERRLNETTQSHAGGGMSGQ